MHLERVLNSPSQSATSFVFGVFMWLGPRLESVWSVSGPRAERVARTNIQDLRICAELLPDVGTE